MAGKSQPETARDSAVRWTRMTQPPPISHPTELKKDIVCKCVCVCVRVFFASTPKPSHAHSHIYTYTQRNFRNCHLSLAPFCSCDRKCSFQLFKISHSSKSPGLILFSLSPFYLTPSLFQVVGNNASFFIYLLLFLLKAFYFLFLQIHIYREREREKGW